MSGVKEAKVQGTLRGLGLVGLQGVGRRCVQRPGHRSEDFSARARAIWPGPVPAAVVSGLAFGFWIANSSKLSKLITKINP